MSLPEAAVRAYLAQPEEIPAALAHARGLGLEPIWSGDALNLRLRLEGPSTAPSAAAVSEEEYLIEGRFDQYRVLPPIWKFLDPRTGQDIGPAAYPQPLGNSVVHPAGLICAHWSRLAYAQHGGPHGNWGGPESWQTRVEGTEALTISDMLARLIWEVQYNTRGRMAPLPQRQAAA